MNTLTTALQKASQTLGIDPEELQLWLDQHMGLPLYPQIQLLRMTDKYQLDPLVDEIGFFQNTDGQYQPFITIDGWSKLINQHPQYAGMSLREASEWVDDVPPWMECTIYRHDRILPIVIKEYLDEVKTNHPSWQQMPKRMLRHRVIQQCARLAFNIPSMDTSVNYGQNCEIKKVSSESKEVTQNITEDQHQNRTAQLKERLKNKGSSLPLK